MMQRVRHDSGFEPPSGPGEWGGSGADDPSDNDWDLSEGLDPEGPSASDLDRFGSEMDTCPNCGSTIYDQSEMCPECGWYLGEVEKSVSIWVIAGIVGLIAILLIWAF